MCWDCDRKNFLLVALRSRLRVVENRNDLLETILSVIRACALDVRSNPCNETMYLLLCAILDIEP